MIVSDLNKFIFWHQPKTAGSSLTEILAPFSNKQGTRLRGFGWQPQYHYGGMHMTAAKTWASMGRPEWKPYFWFCFVRNPFDLVVSAWRNRIETYAKPTGIHKARMDAAGIPNPIPDISLRQFVDLELGNNRFLHIRRTQTDNVITDAPKEMNMIGRFETLDADWARIAKEINVPALLPHRNKSKRESDYRRYYDDETKAIVEQFYLDDLENFNYQF
tara:strand:- start:4557 stop:5207 length:651 start_codon:yes stop_codon:yes gene_type:complete